MIYVSNNSCFPNTLFFVSQLVRVENLAGCGQADLEFGRLFCHKKFNHGL